MSDLAVTVTWHDPKQADVSLRTVVADKCRQIWQAGHAVSVTLRTYEDDKSDRQRRYYHGIVLRAIAQQARPNGERFPFKVWKEHFRAEYLGTERVTRVNPLTGETWQEDRRISTEDLGIRAYSNLIDRVSAFAATELGVTFPMPYDEWERANYDPDTGEARAGVL